MLIGTVEQVIEILKEQCSLNDEIIIPAWLLKGNMAEYIEVQTSFENNSPEVVEAIWKDLSNKREMELFVEDCLNDSIKDCCLIADGWECTDPDTDQWIKQTDEFVFECREMRSALPDEEPELFEATIDLRVYSRDEMYEAMASYGYSKENVEDWIETENKSLIAECLFELLEG